MVAKCLDHSKTELRHSTRATATRTVYISKTTTLHVHQAFLHILNIAIVARLRHEAF